MAIGTQRETRTNFNSERTLIESIQTTDATPVLIYSVPVPQNTTFDITVYQMAIKSDGSNRNCGTIRGIFSRTTGNITQEGTFSKNLIGQLSAAQVTYTPNNSAFTVDIYAGGTTATINWDFTLEIRNKV